MYSPTQQEFFESEQFAHTGLTPHTTVGAVPVSRNRFSNYHYHQRTGSFGAAMSPPNAATMAAAAAAASGGRFADPNAQNWFGTSVDSTGSSFGQSPIFNHMVSPSTSTSHLDNIASAEDEEAQQRKWETLFLPFTYDEVYSLPTICVCVCFLVSRKCSRSGVGDANHTMRSSGVGAIISTNGFMVRTWRVFTRSSDYANWLYLI